MGVDWSADTSQVLADVLAGHPDIATHLGSAHDQAWQVLDPVLAELVRLRVAMLLNNDAELAARTPAAVAAGLTEQMVAALPDWPTSPVFGPRERACLEFVEQWVIDVASVTDEQAAGVAEVLGPDGLATFAAALLVIEQRQRLRLAWTRLFRTTEAP